MLTPLQPQARDPGGCQLDREGQGVHAPADLLDQLVVGGVRAHTGICDPGPEQLDRGGRDVQRSNRDDVLALHAEALPRRRQHVHPNRAEHAIQPRAHRSQHLFAVVDHEQRPPRAALLGEGGGDEVRSGRSRLDRRQVDEAHHVEAALHGCCDGDRETGLAHASHADQGDEPLPLDQPRHRVDLVGTTDERGVAQRQRRPRPGAEWREASGQLRRNQLPQPFGLAQVPEVVHAQIRQRQVRSAPPEQRRRGLADQDLTAMGGSGDARGPIQRAAPIVGTCPLGRTGVDTHPHREPRRRQRELGRNRRMSCWIRCAEGSGDPVAHRREHLSARGPDRLPQHAEVLLDAFVHAGRRLPPAGRAFDVGEQERQRCVGRHGVSPPCTQCEGVRTA